MMRRSFKLISFVSNTRFRKFSISSLKSDEFLQIIYKNGYDGTRFEVETRDGYYLGLHKINSKNYNGKNVLLMHGLYRNSIDYIATGKEIALAYFLADQGFNVWLGNSRGSKFSLNHKKYSHKSSDFWKFNLHELGVFDLRAIMDYISSCKIEDDSRFYYVGHSQGCTMLLILLSMLPEYNNFIKQAHLMTPAIILKHSKSPILTVSAKLEKQLTVLTKYLDKIDTSLMLSIGKWLLYSGDKFNYERAMKIYKNETAKIVGKNKFEVQISKDALRVFQDFMSPIASSCQLLHFLQLHTSGKFQQFDHGQETNLKIYNSTNPPEYNLRNIKVQTFLYSASEDLLTDPEDIEILQEKILNVKQYHNIQDWNHLDVMLGKNSRSLYEKILKNINSCEEL